MDPRETRARGADDPQVSASPTAMPRGRKRLLRASCRARERGPGTPGRPGAAGGPARSAPSSPSSRARDDRRHGGRGGERGSAAPARGALAGGATAARGADPSASRRAARAARRRTGRGGAARHRPLRLRRGAPGGGTCRAAEVARGGLAVLGRLGQRALHDLIERGGKPGPQRRRQRRRLREMRPQPRLVALAVERDRAGQHEVEHAAERVDVGASVDGAAADLLRRGEVERPTQRRTRSGLPSRARAWRGRSPRGRRGRSRRAARSPA